ncbi:MAG: hypothetical protein NVS2B12_36100 [Ktedonobacteraceae bacterium]
MTLYVYRSQNNKHLNRPVKTRLLISVRFVPTIADTCAEPQTEIVSGLLLRPGSQRAQRDAETAQSSNALSEPGDPPSVRGARASLRGAMSMRLRLVGPDASTKKEYHHAKSLLA